VSICRGFDIERPRTSAGFSGRQSKADKPLIQAGSGLNLATGNGSVRAKPNPFIIMKPIVFCRTSLLSLLLATSTAFAGDLETLAGKWTVKKTDEEGQAITQTVEIKKNKLTFTISRADGKISLYATGDIKLEKLGPFNVMKVTNLEAGTSASDLSSENDDRSVIYQLGEDTWTVAMNFDKERDEKPALDVYKKASK
jgi:hypothetical protein